MSELEELPSWAGRGDDGPPAQPTEPIHYTEPPPPDRRRGGVLGLILVGLLALVATGALGFFLARSQGDSGTAAELDEVATPTTTADDAAADDDGSDDASEATADEQTIAVDDEAADDADAADDEAMADEDEAGTDGADADGSGDATDSEDGEGGEDDAAADSDEAADSGDDADTDGSTDTDGGGGLDVTTERQAVFRGGKVYLMGKVPSEEIGRIIEEKAAAVVGPDNVVNEYEIDPSVEIEPGESAPIFVEDVVLFEFNSISIEPPFLPILDLGVLLLRQNPQATLTVVTRTDAVGSEEINLEVARQRAQAVVNYMAGRGVGRDQILADPMGEEGASDEDDEQTAALNRRAEFIITGLLD